MAARYTPLSHDDSDEDSSPQEHLLSVPTMGLRHSEAPTASITLDPAVVLHLASLVMAIIAFTLFILDGDVPFIAADIFLALIMLLDFFIIVHHFISNVFKITVELRNGSWRRDIHGSNKPSVTMYFDIAFTTCFAVCIMVGNGIRGGYGGAWIGGAVLGYLVILVHILLAVPSIHKKTLTLTFTARLSQSQRITAPDIKSSVQPKGRRASSDAGSGAKSCRRRPADDEEPRQPIEDLV